jgi:hypothetical protein
MTQRVVQQRTIQMSVYLANGAKKVVDALAAHYRWSNSQTVTELALYYKRTQEWAHGFLMQRATNGEFVALRRTEEGGIEEVDFQDLCEGIEELRCGVLGAFRKKMPDCAMPWLEDGGVSEYVVDEEGGENA